jgi:uncharacterized protein (TIGR02246 family)
MNTNEAARRWIDGWIRSWKALDAEGVASLYTEDAIFRSHPFREPHVGREGVRAYAQASFDEEKPLDVRFGEPLVEGDRAVVEYWAVLHINGKEVTLAGISVLRFDPDGRCSEQRDYWSMEEGRPRPPQNWGRMK